MESSNIGNPAFFTVLGNSKEIEALDTDTGTWRPATIKEFYPPKTNAHGQIENYDVSVVYHNFSGPKARRTISVNIGHKHWPIRKCTAPKELPKSRSRNILRYDPKTKIVGDTVYTRCGETVTCWNVQLNDPLNRCMTLTKWDPAAEHEISWQEILCLKSTAYDMLTNQPEPALRINQNQPLRIHQKPAISNNEPSTSGTIQEAMQVDELHHDDGTPQQQDTINHVQSAASWVSLISSHY